MKRRSLSSSFRREMEKQETGEAVLIFLTITNPEINEVIRVVSDSVDYVWNGQNFIGFWFDIELLTDDDRPPQATLKIQNVNERIGRALDLLTSPCRVRIDVVAASQFDQTVTPRVAIDTTVAIEYTANNLYLTEVSIDVMEVSGRIVSWDYTQRTWPGIRATKNRCPALYV